MSKEWEDGDDSALYDDGYTRGVRDTVALLNENEGLGLSGQDVINALAIKALYKQLAEGADQWEQQDTP
jgi:hypothetical protein